MKTILVGFDGTEPARRALLRGADLAGAFGSRLVVTTVAPLIVPAPTPGAAIDATAAARQFAAETATDLELAERWREEARALVAGRGLDAEYVVESGVPADVIVQLAEDREADLIVVGTSEPGLLERLLEGSVSQDVSRRAHRDVMIVH